jgi:ribosomal protein L7Ae-like RNA K-turn-binding protein
MMEKLSGLLGLAKKAGALCIGRKATEEQLTRKNVALLLFARNSSTTLQVKLIKKFSPVNHRKLDLTTDALGKVLGRKEIAVLGVCNTHLAREIQNQLDSPF